jgi:hypothetical protein
MQVRALDAVLGGLWRRRVLPPMLAHKLASVDDADVHATVYRWTGHLGAWALDKRDARFLVYVAEVRAARTTACLCVAAVERLAQDECVWNACRFGARAGTRQRPRDSCHYTARSGCSAQGATCM